MPRVIFAYNVQRHMEVATVKSRTKRPTIRLLPALLVNQIAAGEVIERPASVVKELIENSIDAKARQIHITMEDGGRELIEVRDDGCGIDCEQLLLAVSPHATSKIQTAEDLDCIATMGFRGEALASIASISRMKIVSRPSEQEHGALLEAEGEKIQPVQPQAAPVGTCITVRNLFFNTPARRKFLRTAVTEGSRIVSMVESIALAHPHITFTLKHGNRVRLDLPAESSPRRRVLQVIGKELEEQLLEVNVDREAEDDVRRDAGRDRNARSPFSIWGLIGTPEIARGTANHQRLYLNGRPIRDRSLQHALKEAYRGLIEPGRYPTLVLFLEIDPAQVDVNVHPAKAEVRFRNQTRVHGAVLSAVRDRLRADDLTPHFQLDNHRSGETLHLPEFGSGQESATGSTDSTSASPGSFVDYFQRLDPTQKGFVYREVREALAASNPETIAAVESTTEQNQRDSEHSNALPQPKLADEILQVHASYLVTQDETGLVIIDQHALHERVMFEKLKRRINNEESLESQRLLMPEVVEIDRMQAELLDSLQPLLMKIGIDATSMSPTAIAIHAFPSFLFERKVDIQPFMHELFDHAMNDGLLDDAEAALHETLDMMACKAAIKAGDHLSMEELRDLLAFRKTIERSSNCPHGRPTSLRLSIDDLNRQFGRG